jgi:VanZ family protein
MLQHIKTLLKHNSFIIALGVTLSVICLSLIKMPHNPTKITFANIDKVYHGIAYFTLSFSWLIAYYKKPEKKRIIIIGCIIFGIIIELLQSTLTNYRTGDYLDVIANSSGIFIALIIFNLFSKKK